MALPSPASNSIKALLARHVVRYRGIEDLLAQPWGLFSPLYLLGL